MPGNSWLQRFRQLRLVVKRAVATLQAGSLKSVFKGTGLAFEEVRHYQPGDDVRSIDWNVTARMGHPYIKRFVEERELRILFVLDLSGSQQTGSSQYLKRDVAAEVIALLCLAGIRHGDSLGLITFTDQISTYLPPRKGMRHTLRLIYQALYHEPDRHGTDLSKALQFAGKMARRRSVVVILSDFLDNHWQTSLDRLAHRHDIYAICTKDVLDRHLPPSGLIQLRDAETGKSLLIDSATQQHSVPPDFRDGIKAKDRLTWIPLDTQGNHAQQLLKALQKERRRRPVTQR